MIKLLTRWLINAIALLAAAYLVDGIHFQGEWWALLGAALIFGLVNAVIRPLVMLLTCSLVIFTLGLFTLIINALMLLLASWLAGQIGIGFVVDGFWPAFLGAIIISAVSFVLTLLMPDDDRRRPRVTVYHERR